MRASDKQGILEELHPVRRLTKLAHALSREVAILELEQEVQSKVREQLADNQRDYVLREQLKVIRQELGENEDGESEQDEYRARIEKAHMPEEAAKKGGKGSLPV